MALSPYECKPECPLFEDLLDGLDLVDAEPLDEPVPPDVDRDVHLDGRNVGRQGLHRGAWRAGARLPFPHRPGPATLGTGLPPARGVGTAIQDASASGVRRAAPAADVVRGGAAPVCVPGLDPAGPAATPASPGGFTAVRPARETMRHNMADRRHGYLLWLLTVLNSSDRQPGSLRTAILRSRSSLR